MIDDDQPTSSHPAQQTGRRLITFTDDSSHEERVAALQAVEGVDTVASSADVTTESVGPEIFETADATIFERLGIAVADVGPVALESLDAEAEQNPVIVAVEPEHVVRALTTVAHAAHTHLRDGRFEAPVGRLHLSRRWQRNPGCRAGHPIRPHASGFRRPGHRQPILCRG